MPYDNPASRLHALLTSFTHQIDTDTNATVGKAWAKVLVVDEADVPFEIWRVGRLLTETTDAAQATGMTMFDSIPGYVRTLARTVASPDVQLNAGAGNVRPAETPMVVLGMLGEHLRDAAPDGRIPDDDTLASLRQSLADLMAEVTANDELPAESRSDLLRRIAGMIEALDHLNTGGPNAVHRAAEAMAVGAFNTDASKALRSKVATVALIVSMAFSSAAGAATTVNELTTAAQNIGLIEAGDQPRQLTAGPTPPDQQQP